jgi:tRNA threonylcarbamoyl adenosine modification protein YjeE
MIRLRVPTAEAMEQLGARLAALLDAGDLVVLEGPLGAGKTTFVRGLGAALAARGTIASPTFVLAREHPTARGIPLVHVDAYRLSSARELDDLDLDFERSIVVVEWGAGKLDGVADSWIDVVIARPATGEVRDVTLLTHGPRWATIDVAYLVSPEPNAASPEIAAENPGIAGRGGSGTPEAPEKRTPGRRK